MNCGVWNQMKIWSSHLLDNLSNCLMNLKNSGDSTGFEPMSSNPWVRQLLKLSSKCEDHIFSECIITNENLQLKKNYVTTIIAISESYMSNIISSLVSAMARIESGSAFHAFAAKYRKDLRPRLVLLTLGKESYILCPLPWVGLQWGSVPSPDNM